VLGDLDRTPSPNHDQRGVLAESDDEYVEPEQPSQPSPVKKKKQVVRSHDQRLYVNRFFLLSRLALRTIYSEREKKRRHLYRDFPAILLG
jgi:hypothetical protein